MSITARREQQQVAATAAFAELLKANRDQSQLQQRRAPPPARSAQPTTTARPSQSPPRSSPSGHETGIRAIQQLQAQRAQQAKSQTNLVALARLQTRKDLESQLPRRWNPGDVYAPHDLSGVEASKWKKLRGKPKARSRDRDVLDQLGIDPRMEYKNFSMMAEYVSEMGRIKGATETGLRPVNQRRMAKAVRRAIGMGLMPSVYRHPELLRDEFQQRASKG